MRRSSSEPRAERSVVEARGIELPLPHHDDRNPQGIPVEERRVVSDVDAINLERHLESDSVERAIRLCAETAVRLLHEAHVEWRTAMGPPAHERERAPQVPAHHQLGGSPGTLDRKSTRLNSSHLVISYA